MVGENSGTINNSYSINSVSISGDQDVGGLVGHNDSDGKIYNSNASSEDITSSGVNAGGFIGSNLGIVEDSYAIVNDTLTSRGGVY